MSDNRQPPPLVVDRQPSVIVGTNQHSVNLPKLTGQNFQSWKDMVELVLTIKGLKKTITEEHVDEMSDMQARLILLESMDENHRGQTRGCSTAKEIMNRLVLIYADTSASNVYRLLAKFFKYKKQTGDSISVHLGNLDEMRNALADIGEKQSEKLYQVTVLASLPSEYQNMMEIWELTHPELRTTTNLYARLLKREEDLAAQSEDHALAVKDSKTIPIHLRKKLTNCNNCGKKGHWAEECREPVASRSRGSTDLSNNTDRGASFNVNKDELQMKNHWVLESGASSHMANDSGWFSALKMHNNPTNVYVGNGTSAEVTGLRKVMVMSNVNGDKIKIPVSNVLLIPSLSTNLLSVGVLADLGFECKFEANRASILMDGEVFATARKQNDLYILNFLTQDGNKSALITKWERPEAEWHKVLGHPNSTRIKPLIASGELEISTPLTNGDHVECAECAAGKARRVGHPERSEKITEPGKKVHLDLGYINKESVYTYYLLARDEFTKFIFVYSINSKAHVAEAISKLIIDFELGSGTQIKWFHSDNGSEFVNMHVERVLSTNSINHTTSAPYVPEQNGIAERSIQTINSMARTMLPESVIPLKWTFEAIGTAAYLYNRTPTSSCAETPYERLIGRKPTYEHLMMFRQAVLLNEAGASY